MEKIEVEGRHQQQQKEPSPNQDQEGMQQNQKLHDAWKQCDTVQIWDVDPDYEASYSDIQTTHELPLPLAEDHVHTAYAIGWVNTNKQHEHIDINMAELVIRSKGKVIANIQTLTI